jgi:hypothetical protein
LTQIVRSETPSPQSFDFRRASPNLQPSQSAPSANRAASIDHESTPYSAPNPGHAQQLSRNLALILLLPHWNGETSGSPFQLTPAPGLRVS